MTFRVLVGPKAQRFIDRLDRETAQRIQSKLRDLRQDPLRYLRCLHGETAMKLRVGDYRMLIDVDRRRRIVWVRHIDHRRRFYKHRH